MYEPPTPDAPERAAAAWIDARAARCPQGGAANTKRPKVPPRLPLAALPESPTPALIVVRAARRHGFPAPVAPTRSQPVETGRAEAEPPA